jgi:hypothetical protein
MPRRATFWGKTTYDFGSLLKKIISQRKNRRTKNLNNKKRSTFWINVFTGSLICSPFIEISATGGLFSIIFKISFSALFSLFSQRGFQGPLKKIYI